MFLSSKEVEKTSWKAGPVYHEKTEVFKCDDCGRKGEDGVIRNSGVNVGKYEFDIEKLGVKASTKGEGLYDLLVKHVTSPECTSPKTRPKKT